MIELIKKHKKFLLFAFLVSFFSGFGQTFLLSLFNQSLEKDLHIDNLTLSKTYALATLLASVFIPLVGKAVDNYSIKTVTVIISMLLGLSFILFAHVSGPIELFFCYFSLRLLGQSSLPLVGTTQIAKYFGRFRGKVQSITSMGRPLVEAVLPSIVIFLLFEYGFQVTSYILGLSFLLFLIPSSLILLNGFSPKQFYEENENAIYLNKKEESLKSIYKGWKIYFFSFSNIGLGFVMTGIFFHNPAILAFKSWSLSLWASCFAVMSLFSLLSNFLSGYLIDRYGAMKIARLKYLPMFLAFIPLIYLDSSLSCAVFFAFVGISVGIASNTHAAVIAEIFGGKNLGTIKSVDIAFMVVSTSLAPVVFSYGLKFLGVQGFLLTLMSFILFLTVCLNYSYHLYKK